MLEYPKMLYRQGRGLGPEYVEIGGRSFETLIVADVDGEAASSADDWEGFASAVAALPSIAGLAALDHDGDGQPGGSLKRNPPALTGKNKAKLLEIAAAEGAEVEDGAKVADIVVAIELHREADA